MNEWMALIRIAGGPAVARRYVRIRTGGATLTRGGRLGKGIEGGITKRQNIVGLWAWRPPHPPSPTRTPTLTPASPGWRLLEEVGWLNLKLETSP